MSGRIYKNIIEVRQGDSFNIGIEFHNCCKPVDSSEYALLMQVRDKSGVLQFACEGENIDAKNGKMVLRLTPELTSLDVGEYECDIQVTAPDGSVNTIFPANVNAVGVFKITRQITQ